MPIIKPTATRQPVLAPNVPVGAYRDPGVPAALPPRGQPVILRGGAEYAIADANKPNAAAPPPVKAAARPKIPAGSEAMWPGGGTRGLLDRLSAATRRSLGITGSNKLV